MKTQFPREKIRATKSYFVNNFPFVKDEVAGRRFGYFVMPAIPQGLKNFAFRCTGKSNEYVLGVSDEVPEEYRKFWAFHEYVEYVEGKKCIEALEEELRVVPEEIRTGYLTLRAEFFRNLVEYCTNAGNYDLETIAEFTESRNKLESIVGEK